MQIFHDVLTKKQYDENLNEQRQFAVIFDNFITKFDFESLIRKDMHKPILKPLMN